MTRAERPCPQYKQHDLERALPELEVEITFLLRHGIQEYILGYELGSSSPSLESPE